MNPKDDLRADFRARLTEPFTPAFRAWLDAATGTLARFGFQGYDSMADALADLYALRLHVDE